MGGMLGPPYLAENAPETRKGAKSVAAFAASDYHLPMFFYLSKIFWFIVNPANVLLFLLCLGAWLSWTRWRRTGRWLLGLAALFALFLASVPLGANLLLGLENRFPTVRQLPDKVDGIISLGGVVNQFITRARGQVALGGSVERLTEFATLARRYPEAKLVFTGGSGRIFNQDIKEAEVLEPFLETLGLDPKRVILENQSRNTYENALNTYKLVRPGPDETWILVTSASHMPRSVGSFRKAGWRVIPYPVDYNFKGDEQFELSFNLGTGMGMLNGGLHEWAGLFFYWLAGRSDDLFPAPDGR